MIEEMIVRTGQCQFCGKKMEVMARSQEEADSIATADCSCAKSMRKKEYDAMITNLNALLGSGCEQYGFKPVEGRIGDLIVEVADMIFDKKSGKATFAIDGTTIKLTESKDSVKIAREKVNKVTFD